MFILLRLAEDVVTFQTLPTQRRRDIQQTLTQNMERIFSFLLSTLQENVNKYQQMVWILPRKVLSSQAGTYTLLIFWARTLLWSCTFTTLLPFVLSEVLAKLPRMSLTPLTIQAGHEFVILSFAPWVAGIADLCAGYSRCLVFDLNVMFFVLGCLFVVFVKMAFHGDMRVYGFAERKAFFFFFLFFFGMGSFKTRFFSV